MSEKQYHANRPVDEGAFQKSHKEKLPEELAASKARARARIDDQKKEIRYSKKLFFVGIGILLAIVVFLLVRIYFIGSLANANEYSYDIDVSDKTIHLSGAFHTGAEVAMLKEVGMTNFSVVQGEKFRSVSFDEHNGTVRIFLNAIPMNVWTGSYDFDETYQAKEDIQKVLLNSKVIWEAGR